jgi:hypothetical protein
MPRTDAFHHRLMKLQLVVGCHPFHDVNHFRVASLILDGERPKRPDNPSPVFTQCVWSLITIIWRDRGDRPPMSEISAVLQVINAMKSIEPQLTLQSTLEEFGRTGMEKSVANLLNSIGKASDTYDSKPLDRPPGLRSFCSRGNTS